MTTPPTSAQSCNPRSTGPLAVRLLLAGCFAALLVPAVAHAQPTPQWPGQQEPITVAAPTDEQNLRALYRIDRDGNDSRPHARPS